MSKTARERGAQSFDAFIKYLESQEPGTIILYKRGAPSIGYVITRLETAETYGKKHKRWVKTGPNSKRITSEALATEINMSREFALLTLEDQEEIFNKH